MTMSIPSIWSSGNMRPASTTTRQSAVSRVIRLRPSSPRPPRKVRSTQLRLGVSGAMGKVGVVGGLDGLAYCGHEVLFAAEGVRCDGGRDDHLYRSRSHPHGPPRLNEAGAADAHRHNGLPRLYGHDEYPFLEGQKLPG